MRLKNSIILTLTIIISITGLSQNSSFSKKDKYKFQFAFDARRSFLLDHSVKFWGLKFGIENSKHRFGISFHGTSEPIRTTRVPSNIEGFSDTLFFEYSYLSPYYEKILFHNKRWDLSAPIHLNIGSVRASGIDTSGNMKQLFQTNDFFSLVVSVKSYFKIWRWIGPGAGIGYNQALVSDKRIRKSVSAPFYSFGVKIFLGELFRMVFTPKKLEEW